jgi:hypothetical protein
VERHHDRRDRQRHAVQDGEPVSGRIKVNQSHGTRMLPGNLATVAVRPASRLVAGQLSAADLQLVSQWIALNESALVDYWEYRISTPEFIRRLQKVPP